MARNRNRKDGPSKIPLKHPDRSGPSDQTLLQLAEEHDLFSQADKQQKLNRAKKSSGGKPVTEAEDEEGIPASVERVMDTLLYSVSLAMLHFTLDVLVQNQYAIEIDWRHTATRAGQALLVFGFLFYNLHPNPSAPILLPGLPRRHQPLLRQLVFLSMGTVAGCYLIYITNEHGYLAVMKRAPPVACLWVWAVIELNLGLAVLSLTCAGFYMWLGGYKFS